MKSGSSSPFGGARLGRREFVRTASVLTAGLAAGFSVPNAPAASRTRNHNSDMQYRPLGKTGLMVSCVCLGGHWKRLETVLPQVFKRGESWINADITNSAEFNENRYGVVSRCMERGINYIDACVSSEVMAYAKALKGRRDQMFLGYSWYEKEARFPEWRSAKKLLLSLDEGLQAAGLDYVDLWRITCFEQGADHTFAESDEIAAALARAKEQGKTRFTGVSSHHRHWLKMMIEQYPDQIQVVLTPYTSNTKELAHESLFEAVRQHHVGVFGIKPFASNSLFKGDSSLASNQREEDDRRARLAIRYVLCNKAVTAPIPGLINTRQVDNVAQAVREQKKNGVRDLAELDIINRETWAKLPPSYQWLKDWEYV